MTHYAAVCALGAMAGGAFAWLWLWIVPRGTHRGFWSALSATAREMLRVEETRVFVSLYAHLGRLLGPYLARNLGGTVLACLPMVLILVFLAAPVFEAWDAKAQRVTLAPPDAARRLAMPVPYRTGRTGYCSSAGYCTLLAALDFHVVALPQPDVPYAVLRADHDDVNPLWPFLSDIEAAFFLAFALSTAIGLLWRRRS
jgi:hypothetical protein